MPTSGSGQGTPIPAPVVPGSDINFNEFIRYDGLALPLAYYPKLIGYDECAFWGVMTNENQNSSDCSELFTEADRTQLFYALYEAQQRIEDFLGYFLLPTFVAGTLSDAVPYDERFVDQIEYQNHFQTRWANLLEFGKRTEVFLAQGTAVSYASDPVVLGPFAATIGDVYEIKIYHPDSNREITPSKIIYSGGNLTIHIPKCRLIKESLLEIGTSDTGFQYEIDSYFEDTVDIKRVYADTTYQANLISQHSCNAWCSSNLCSEFSQTGCVYIQNPKLGQITASPGNYNEVSSKWAYSNNNLCYCNYHSVRLYYRSGLKYLSPQIYDAIIRLAHTLLPDEPCNCVRVENQWRSDREIPRNLSRAKQNCPFGEMNGAWQAWRSVQRLKIYRAGSMQ